MAIDSERKRKSIAAVSLQSLGPVVVPDGSLSQGDRQAIGYSYFGISAGQAASIQYMYVVSSTIAVSSSTATIGVSTSTGTIQA